MRTANDECLAKVELARTPDAEINYNRASSRYGFSHDTLRRSAAVAVAAAAASSERDFVVRPSAESSVDVDGKFRTGEYNRLE